MRIAVFAIIAVLGAVFFCAAPAFAWGPSAHIYIGREVLGRAAIFAPAIRDLLIVHPLDFLYGSVFADMNLGKKFFLFSRLAHNWKVGMSLKQSARTDENRSCAYGYLAHLAADTIAHNEYVPKKLVEHYAIKGRGHIFLEGRFDIILPDRNIHKYSKKVVEVGAFNNDKFLESSIARTLFSFNTNRRLYRGILRFHHNNSVQAYRRRRVQHKKTVISVEEARDYLDKCVEAVVDFLQNERSSEIYARDPHGKKAIKQATRLRHSLRARQHGGTITPDSLKEALRQISIGPRRGT